MNETVEVRPSSEGWTYLIKGNVVAWEDKHEIIVFRHSLTKNDLNAVVKLVNKKPTVK